MIEVISVATRIEAEERTEEETDGGFVGNDEDISALVGTDDFDEFGESASGDGESAFAVERCKGKRIFIPSGGFFGEF